MTFILHFISSPQFTFPRSLLRRNSSWGWAAGGRRETVGRVIPTLELAPWDLRELFLPFHTVHGVLQARESPLHCKEIKPVNPKGNQPRGFICGEAFHSGQRSWGRRLGIRKCGIEPQESTWMFSTSPPQKKTGVCLLYCFVLSPLISLGAVPHHHLALSVKELTYSSNS